MNDGSACRAEGGAAATPQTAGTCARERILVWDLPVRVFHWAMVLCFAGAYLSAESERWRLLHVTLGYTMAGLVVFRLLWGLIGTRHARFADFVRGPRAVARYVGAMLRGEPETTVGHNPVGALAIVALLGLTAIVAISGWANYNDVGGHWTEDWHEGAANAMLAVVGVHVAGVLLASLRQRENLVAAMVTGRKRGPAGQAITRRWRSVALLMIVAMLGFAWLQWRSAPASGGFAPAASGAERQGGHDGDDD
jgi:cytochrome b